MVSPRLQALLDEYGATLEIDDALAEMVATAAAKGGAEQGVPAIVFHTTRWPFSTAARVSLGKSSHDPPRAKIQIGVPKAAVRRGKLRDVYPYAASVGQMAADYNRLGFVRAARRRRLWSLAISAAIAVPGVLGIAETIGEHRWRTEDIPALTGLGLVALLAVSGLSWGVATALNPFELRALRAQKRADNPQQPLVQFKYRRARRSGYEA
ncbi:MAG TPA: hypothetical protein VLE99_06360 [Candidatus Saccharimonadales bacterium]|nr:hypothetical protein [Candidatus Saccharimonadales bacterium]